MKVDDYRATKANADHKEQTSYVECNAIYPREANVNYWLTASQAIEYARRLLE